MNPSAINAGEPGYSLEPRSPWEDLPSSKDRTAHHAAWLLEEPEEPETWSLASFEDLLPHDLA